MNILRIHKEGGVQVELRCSFGGVVSKRKKLEVFAKEDLQTIMYRIILTG